MTSVKDENSLSDFKTVKYNRKKHKTKVSYAKSHDCNLPADSNFFDKDSVLRFIKTAKDEIAITDLYDSCKASLREGLVTLKSPKISEIICLGLGHVGEFLVPRYQFALLLCLRDLYNVDVSVFDPVFTTKDKEIFEHFNCKVLTENLEGKYRVTKTTLFYLPHCECDLVNNLLWSNWGLDLNYCVVINNSFHSISENFSTSKDCMDTEYIQKILAYVLEIPIVNTFKYFDVFNDTAIHFFPDKTLNLITGDFWKDCPEPQPITLESLKIKLPN